MDTRLDNITSSVVLLKFMLNVKVRAKSVPLTTSDTVRKLTDACFSPHHFFCVSLYSRM